MPGGCPGRPLIKSVETLCAEHTVFPETNCWVATRVKENFITCPWLGRSMGERYAHRVLFRTMYPDIDIKDCALTRCLHNKYCANPEHLSVGYHNGPSLNLWKKKKALSESA